MRNPGGYMTITAPDEKSRTIYMSGVRHADKEADTFTCGHCNRVVLVKPMCDPTEMGGMCKCCMSLVCGPCYGHGVCTPIEKKVEQWEDKHRFLRSMQEWG